MSGSLTRRAFIRSVAIGSVGMVAVACASPAPTAPAKPPAASTPPAAASATAGSGAGAVQDEWNKLVAAAKQEGALNSATLVGTGQRKVMDDFEAAFPGIKVEHTGFTGYSLFIPRVVQERAAGIYAWDVSVHSADVHIGPGALRDNGALDPIRPILIRPDVLDDKAWINGFEFGFPDIDKKWGYGITWTKTGNAFWVNTDIVKDGQVQSIVDLLKPEFKGKKMIFIDPRVNGNAYQPMTVVRLNMGSSDIIKQLFVDQDPVIAKDTNQINQDMARGKYGVSLGIDTASIQDMQKQGLANNLKPIAIKEGVGVNMGTCAWLFNKAPHPNTAKLFLNWLLTEEGQKSWATNVATNSRRIGVPQGNPSLYGAPDETFKVVQGTEDMIKELAQTQAIAKQVIPS
jgi:ABC-type Fe3+ transport system substrate-binding protein